MLHDRKLRPFAFLDRHLVNGLRLIWILVVLWCESWVFYYSLVGCRWPDAALSIASGHNAVRTHIMVVADPQILDHRSYPGRHPWLMTLSQFIVDLNLRKSWRAAQQWLAPQIVVFLGDMMDGGRFDMSDKEYETYYKRFKSIFQMDNSTLVYYLPGNHDIGLRLTPLLSIQAKERYVSHFGPLNHQVSIANHTLLFLDASSLVEEDYLRAAHHLSYDQWTPRPEGTIDFIKNVPVGEHLDPVVLFSHIPLSRPESASCGPLRERGSIRRGIGAGYQNTLGRETTNFLFEHTQPVVIFSGDDHDYCEYFHRRNNLQNQSEIREVTVKSFSMAMGIKRPGFQLLSLADSHSVSTTSPTHSDIPCLLPDQLGIYLSVYVPLTIVSLLILLFYNLYHLHASRRFSNWSHARSQSPIVASGSEAIWVSSSRGTSGARARFDSEDNADIDTSYENSKNAEDASTPVLPAPGSTNSLRHHQPDSRLSLFLVLRRRLGKAMYSLLGWISRDPKRGRRRRGFVHMFLGDVVDVAVPPLILLVLIVWWMFSDYA